MNFSRLLPRLISSTFCDRHQSIQRSSSSSLAGTRRIYIRCSKKGTPRTHIPNKSRRNDKSRTRANSFNRARSREKDDASVYKGAAYSRREESVCECRTKKETRERTGETSRGENREKKKIGEKRRERERNKKGKERFVAPLRARAAQKQDNKLVQCVCFTLPGCLMQFATRPSPPNSLPPSSPPSPPSPPTLMSRSRT